VNGYSGLYPRGVDLPASERVYCHCYMNPKVNAEILGLPGTEKRLIRDRNMSGEISAPSSSILPTTKLLPRVEPFDHTKTKHHKDVISNLTKGNKLVNSTSDKIDVEAARDLFGEGTTEEGLLNVFNPNSSKYKIRFNSPLKVQSVDGGASFAELSMSVEDFNDGQLATIRRTIVKRDGRYVIKHDYMEVDDNVQGEGIGTAIYYRSEQLYKTIANGSPVDIKTLANVDIGVYAWSRHGFDFVDPEMLELTKSKVTSKISKGIKSRASAGEFGKPGKDFTPLEWNNEIKPALIQKELQDTLGYNHIDDIKHAWQVGALDDGIVYSGYNGEEKLTFGKDILLNESDSWNGVKKLNQDHDSELIGNMYYQYKGVTK